MGRGRGNKRHAPQGSAGNRSLTVRLDKDKMTLICQALGSIDPRQVSAAGHKECE
jgi:hypothetical protein